MTVRAAPRNVSLATSTNDDIRVFRDLSRECRGAARRSRGATLSIMGKGTLIAGRFAEQPHRDAGRPLDAQVGSRRLTIDDIYNPTRRINFSGTPETGITWLDPATYLTRRRAAGGTEWLKVDALSGSHVAAVRRQCHGGGTRVAARRHVATRRRQIARSGDLTF